MAFKKNELEFESNKVKVYVQQLQAENTLLRQANEEKRELLIKLGCPTKATAKRKVLCLQQQLDQLKIENEELKEKVKKYGEINVQETKDYTELKAENAELTGYKSLFEKTRNLWNESRMNNYKLLDEIKDLKDSLKRTICQSECYKHKEADKLSKTLTEIKEIAEEQKNSCDFCWSCEECSYYCYSKQILQKISEVMPDEKVV